MKTTKYTIEALRQRIAEQQWAKIDALEGNATTLAQALAQERVDLERICGEVAAAEIRAQHAVIDKWIKPSLMPGDKWISIYDTGDRIALCGIQESADECVVWLFWKTEEDRRHHSDEVAMAGLATLAELALGERRNVSLTPSEQQDLAFTWKAPAVHPLQISENAYQRVVAEALSENPPDPKEAQSNALSQFFFINSAPPEQFRYKPLPVPQGPQFASVRMNHLIDSFYLFRLLIAFRVESSQEIDESLRNELSGNLTKLLHNDLRMQWLNDWLTKKIAELGRAVDRLNGTGERRVIFFLKGGRALNYWLGTPEKGENDWDTQIVINPLLSQEEWYRCFREVHDLMLALLTKFRAEFTELLKEHAEDFARYLADKAEPQDSDDDDDDDDEFDRADTTTLEHANCKAELIDIGIPRRDQPAALEEWTRLTANGALATARNGIIYPTRHYYVNEYLMMIRDAMLPNADARKAPKRIARFQAVLSTPSHEDIDPSGRLRAFPGSYQRIAELPHAEDRELLQLIGAEFVEAYNLRQESDLVSLIDEKFAAMLPADDAIQSRVLPASMAMLDLPDDQKRIVADVFIADRLSAALEAQARERHRWMVGHAADFLDFLRDLFQALQKAPVMLEHGAQLAISGGFAAWLHSRHLRLKPAGLEPIRRILVKLQHPSGSPPRANVLLDGVLSDIENIAGQYTWLKMKIVDDRPRKSLVFFIDQPITFGEFTYRPLVLKIREAEQVGQRLPISSLLEGVPVTDLRHIIADYTRRAAKIDEFGARRILKTARETALLMATNLDVHLDDDDD